MIEAKSYKISKREVWEAWKEIKTNRGSGGVDGETIKTFETKLERNLYKLWNRMSSGSYLPKPVRQVSIPKSDGGQRLLGIPTIEDRIAQTVVKRQLEPILEKIFHKDSYGYRPGKSAHQALDITRQRCWKYNWVVDIDIRKFFDSIDHELMMKAVCHHTRERWVILYVERWLRAPVQKEDGTIEQRTKGTPQGGVISPLLANLYLHYVLDAWMQRKYPNVPFARYADDLVIHARTEAEGKSLMMAVNERFQECSLSLNTEKSKIVYCKDQRRTGNYDCTQFTFLGYLFRQRSLKTRADEMLMGFNPAISPKAIKRIGTEMRRWTLHLRSDLSLEKIAAWVNSKVRGWIAYYTRYFKSVFSRLLYRLNFILIKWVARKHKDLRKRFDRAYAYLRGIARRQPNLFVHWQFGARLSTRP